MANEQQTDKEVSLTLNRSEIFQINLSITTRLSYIQTRWASAITQQEQDACENQLAYLTNLQRKLSEILNETK